MILGEKLALIARVFRRVSTYMSVTVTGDLKRMKNVTRHAEEIN